MTPHQSYKVPHSEYDTLNEASSGCQIAQSKALEQERYNESAKVTLGVEGTA